MLAHTFSSQHKVTISRGLKSRVKFYRHDFLLSTCLAADNIYRNIISLQCRRIDVGTSKNQSSIKNADIFD